MMWYDIVQTVCFIMMAIFSTVFIVTTIISWKRPPKIIYVEDGSLSDETIEELENNGYIVVIYRQGSRPPEVLK